jgi:hypothetical protein
MKGIAFTRSQVLTCARNLADDPELFRSNGSQTQFSAVFRRSTFALCMPGVKPRQERRFRISLNKLTGMHVGTQERGYVRTRLNEKLCDSMSHDEVRTEIEKNGVLTFEGLYAVPDDDA